MAVPFPARVLIADDHVVVREGLKALFERQPDLRVTAEAVDGVEAVEKAINGDIDLAIIDVAMPKLTGLQAVREISRRRSDLPILLLSMYDREQYFFEAVAAGAAGYVLKRQADRDALRGVPRGAARRIVHQPACAWVIMRRYIDRIANGRATRPRPAHPSRDPSGETGRRRPQLAGHRQPADDKPQDRRTAPNEHPRQARHPRPSRNDPLRHPVGARRAVTSSRVP